MSDLAVLAGFSNEQSFSASYHLQEMGIDVWKLRKIVASKVLVLIFNHVEVEDLPTIESLLLNNMLASTRLDKDIFDIEQVTDMEALTSKDLRKYAAVVTFGDEGSRSAFAGLPQYNILHPRNLVGSTNDKKSAYLLLHNLRELLDTM